MYNDLLNVICKCQQVYQTHMFKEPIITNHKVFKLINDFLENNATTKQIIILKKRK